MADDEKAELDPDFVVRHKPAMPRPLLAASRDLRRGATSAEQLLWEELRNRRLCGAKFRRQAVIGRLVVDFYCHEARLVVELDGPAHDTPEQKAHDVERQSLLEVQGVRVLRFPNEQVQSNLPAVLETIIRYLADPPLLPPGEGAGG